MVEAGGRVVRWKHTLYDWLKVSKVELAIIAELLLRGPQTEGDLRPGQPDGAASRPPRASRRSGRPGRPGLVVFLSPPGQKRGVVVTHGLYPPDELERKRNVREPRSARRRARATRPDHRRPSPTPPRRSRRRGRRDPGGAGRRFAIGAEPSGGGVQGS